MERKQEILQILERVYRGAKPALEYRNPYELLVATILSAQCTDVRVNIVTRELFPKYPTAASLAAADYETLCSEIKSCGFYQTKARHLIDAAKTIMKEYGGEVPKTMEELTTLAGVGRKTANVVLSNAFGIPGLAVDTHVLRVSNRLGLVDAPNDPLKTEQQLCALIDREQWGDAHHWLIWHGRKVCAARKPNCENCPLNAFCRYWSEQK